ncbi:hypothetical protein MRBLMI12_000521 [Microbacterium sp. LMI12-1-1.1]|uniref:hypothetical protein n=1 Tax=Microbacterium sp. LMI12-1-1.1 TaxID=3135225 RepID=UPI00343E13D3
MADVKKDQAARLPVDPALFESQLSDTERLALTRNDAQRTAEAVQYATVAVYRDYDARLELEIKRLHELKEATIAARSIARRAVMGE